MDVIQTIGADAMRYTLLSQTGENQGLRYSERKTEEARNLCNKIWNATRFVLMNIEGPVSAPETLTNVDKWLLSRLYQTEKAVRAAYDGYDVQSACQAMYRFFWSELCDWYIEVSKPRLNDPAGKAIPQWVLLTAFDAFLKMMHPVMPHITEELYQHLPITGKSEFLMSAPWPEIPESFNEPDAERKIARVFEVTRAFRALRAELDLAPIKPVPAAYYEGDLEGDESVLTSQGWIQELLPGKPPEGRFVSATAEGIDLHLPISGLVDVDKELNRLQREQEKALADLAKIEARLANPQFTERAKPEVVEKEQATLVALKEQLVKIEERRRLFANQ
jgi:valyl-tRNA synthetase